jgi:hypothetical protein
MSVYDDLLEEVRTKVAAFRQTTAKEYIPQMYLALHDENPDLAPEDVRERIEKDCLDIWKPRTILDALPDEAKDLIKQKSARARQNKANCAADTAAPIKKKEEIVIDIEGKPADSFIPPPTGSLSTLSQSSNSDNQLQDNNLLQFQFSLPVQYVLGHIVPIIPKKEDTENQMWFTGVLDKRTGRVISATIVRTRGGSSENDTSDESDR